MIGWVGKLASSRLEHMPSCLPSCTPGRVNPPYEVIVVVSLTLHPQVWSISWGGGESSYPLEAQRAADACFARAALKGVSVLAASGDDGTGGEAEASEAERRASKAEAEGD